MNRFDINRIAETNRRTLAMLKLCHRALRDIVTTEPGLDGGIYAQAVARDTLVELETMASASSASSARSAAKPATEVAA